MIGKTKWFGRRKYTGWGLTPKTWQGWAYVAGMVLPTVIISNLPIERGLQTLLMLVWIGIFIIDIIDMMIHLEKDERDITHEALAERNAAWVMIATLTIGFSYQVAVSAVRQSVQVDPFIFIAIFSGLIAKALTNWYLRDK
jgi:UDP-N-acetylmuramyl pentapeptide phosphotransferase/UDP-N-acetylglucosamine-1-phosphate transferase